LNSIGLVAGLKVDKCQGEFTNWKPSKYNNQKNVLGYSRDVFKTSENESLIVKFWIDVYTKFTTHHGIIHNSEYPEIIYEVVDFTNIDNDPSIKMNKKEEYRNLLVRSAKERILFSLNKLANNDYSEKINSYDQRIIDAFKVLSKPPRYSQAADMKLLRFQLGQSDRMKDAIKKSGRYLPMMEEIFKNEGLPKELTRIVFVESSFNVSSYSKVGASGLWQIMPSVAKGNLKINSQVDYRNHPLEATKLAAKILKNNYINLGSWPLAITAYNHGVNGVKRLTEINETKDLYEIIDTGVYTNSFGFASRNFYYSFLAALEVENSADTYFSDICKFSRIGMLEALLPKPMKYKKFIEFFNGDTDLAYSFNPHFQKTIYDNVSYIPRKVKVLIPEASKRELLNTIGVTNRIDGIVQKYFVGKGDSLSRISKQFKVSIEEILDWNELTHPNSIKAGQLLIVSKH
jgi:membrane-bound lytic murein transglycosylase D